MAASLLKKMADKCRNVSFRRFQSLQFPATFRNVPIPRFRPFFVFRREFRSEQGYWDVDKGGSEGVDAKIQGVSKPEASGGEGADGGTGPGQEVIEEIQILNGRVNRYYREGMYVEALDTAHRAHELIITHYGERHMFAASIVNNKALINKHLGKLEEAGRMYKISMELYHDAVGSEHPSYATATHNLALVERLRGSTDEAIRLFSLALDIRRKVHGPEHVDVAVSMHNLGSALRDKGDLDQALNLQENALVILRRRVSTEHLSTGPSFFVFPEKYLPLFFFLLTNRFLSSSLSLLTISVSLSHFLTINSLCLSLLIINPSDFSRSTSKSQSVSLSLSLLFLSVGLRLFCFFR
ncbi:hypothetical protein AAMO2058_000922100 [Amorphochlora amoebiformis]